MPRLIDADKAKEVLIDYYHIRTNIQQMSMEEAFSRVPTVDAEPVRHGRWINDFSSSLKCSSCGIVSKANEITLRTDFKFCPYCGAKMEEENAKID